MSRIAQYPSYLFASSMAVSGVEVTRALENVVNGHFSTDTVTIVPRSYVSRSTFRTCLSFSSMTSSTFYHLLPLTHAYDFHMLTVFTCFSFTYFVRLPCTI